MFESLRKTCLHYYSLDPAHYYTSPGLPWDACLKETGQELQLLHDYDMLMMFERGIRGGITNTSKRYAEANNKNMENYDPSKSSTYIQYLDANSKVDHFVDFINRPYFYQVVSYGNKVLTLDNGDRIEMPNVVRILTRSTMIEQYLEYCKEQCHEPLSRSTLFKILEVREASQLNSLQGLDNTAADGAAGFQTIETLVETLEKGGM